MEEIGVTAGPLVDLSCIAQSDRALMWRNAARDAFPSLSVALSGPQPGSGLIERVSLGSSEFYTITSAPADVRHQPSGDRAYRPCISVMIQLAGAMVVRQAGRCARLEAGDLCLIDEAKSFRLLGEDDSAILFVRVPRAVVLSRHPRLEKLFITTLPGDEPGTAILSDTLKRVARDCEALGEAQRSAMAGTIVQMLGLAECLAESEEGSQWRVRRALDFIELNLSAAGLTAEMVAQDQNISRRRLDQLMHEAFGCSVAAHLWRRRLEQAAADLRDRNRSKLSIAQIAFSNGFEDPAHFTRAFKRRFAVTPGQWRLN